MTNSTFNRFLHKAICEERRRKKVYYLPKEHQPFRHSDKHCDVLVVGGGIAGLTAATYLAQKGQSVLLCEKESQVGGLVSGFERQGFTFDGGIRALENAGTLIPMLRSLGIEADLIKSDVNLKIGERNTTISRSGGLKEYAKMLAFHFPDNKRDIARIIRLIERTVKNMDVLYGVENPLFSPLWNEPKKLFKKMLPWLVRYLSTVIEINLARQPVEKKLADLTQNRALCDMVIQHFFSGSPTFFALGYFWLYGDYYYPKNSIKHIAELMQEHITVNGGRVQCNTEVIDINIRKSMVTLQDGNRVQYDRMIWCCSKKSLIRRSGATIQHSNHALKQRGSNSVLTLYLAVDIPAKNVGAICGSHMFFTPSIEGLSSLRLPNSNTTTPELKNYVESYLRLTTFEISCPAVINPRLAPPGRCALIVGTLFEYEIAKRFDDEGMHDEFKAICREVIIDTLDKTLIKGIKEHLIFCECSTPLCLERRTANDDGAITGWSHLSSPMPAVTGFTAIARSINTDLPSVYQAGMWTFSPAGLPVSIITGRLAADKALRDLGASKVKRNSKTE